jgi:hypothetical protein
VYLRIYHSACLCIFMYLAIHPQVCRLSVRSSIHNCRSIICLYSTYLSISVSIYPSLCSYPPASLCICTLPNLICPKFRHPCRNVQRDSTCKYPIKSLCSTQNKHCTKTAILWTVCSGVGHFVPAGLVASVALTWGKVGSEGLWPGCGMPCEILGSYCGIAIRRS